MLSSETFFDGDACTGVLLRDQRHDELATFICFELEPEVLYRAEQITAIGPGATDWTSFRFAEASSGVKTEAVRTPDGVAIDGVVIEPDAVPSYLAHRVVVALAMDGGDRFSYRQVDEHGDPKVRDVDVVRRTEETVRLPGGSPTTATRYDLLLDGDPYTAFWWDGTRIVLSDWTAGSMSVVAPDLDSALTTAPVAVAEVARAWVSGRDPVG